MTKLKLGLVAGVVLLTTVATHASASTNLVLNGGFEDAIPTTDWTFTSWSVDTSPADANSGNNAASSQCFDASCADPTNASAKFISQTITGLTPGSYLLSIAGNPGPGNDPSTTNDLRVYFGGQLILDTINALPNAGQNVWNTYTTPFSVGGTSGELKILAWSTGNYHIDDVSITSDAAVGGVPEPATWALLIGGFGVAGASLRRRRSAAAL